MRGGDALFNIYRPLQNVNFVSLYYIEMCVCMCVKKCVPLDTRLRQKEKEKKEEYEILLYVYWINYRTFYILPLNSNSRMVASSRERVPFGERGMLFVLHRVYYYLLCTTACLCKTRTFSYQNDNFSREDWTLLKPQLCL